MSNSEAFEAFEAWYQNSYVCFGQANFHLNSYGEYFDDDIEASWCAWQAALAQSNEVKQSQAQQPSIEDQRAKLVVNMVKYLGATKTQAKAIVDGVFDGEHTIKESDLQSQAQQAESQWISVDERLPEGYKPVLVATNFGDVYTCRLPVIIAKNSKEESSVGKRERFTHWMPLPPSPMNEVNKPEGE